MPQAKGKGTPTNLKVVGEQPDTYEILTRDGVVTALWNILEDAKRAEGEPEAENGEKK